MSRQLGSGWQMVFLALLVAGCVISSGCVTETEKVYKVGILCGLDYIADISDGFKDKMTELGYVEGENIIYELQTTNFEPEKEKQILNQFVEDNVDLIFTFPTEVSMFAKEATEGTDVPVVFCFANIEDTGLVESVRQPGGHITGVRYPGPDLAIKRFEIMLEMAPDAKRVWIPYQRGYPIVESQMEVLYPVAEAAGVTLIEFPADNAAELQAGLDAIAAPGVIDIDFILFIAEPLAVTPDAFEVMGRFASENNVPIGGALMEVGGYGSIFGVNVDIMKTAEQAAVLADKVLRGMDAGTIPVVSSESYFEINYNAVQEFGLNVSEGLLARADKIIR
jgi:putative ABC transport system substrate-binding protein